jgi:hypothetical protein
MLFFKKKVKAQTDVDERRAKRMCQIVELSQKFPLGSKFTYLGVECIVTGVERIFYDYRYDMCLGAIPLMGVAPQLRADYVDKNGVIRELTLSYSEAMRI